MVVAVAGAHGQIALHLLALLSAAGDEVIGLIRNPDHAADVAARGATPVICDLERVEAEELATAIAGAEAVVFAAGAGPGSGPERKLTVDRDGAVKLLEAAQAAGVPRYVMISAVGAENPPAGDEVFAVYLRAKAQADEAVRASDRAWTILRPGRLTDEPATGTVQIQAEPFRGEVTRADIAAVVAAVLGERRAAGRVLYVNGGPDPVERALARVLD